MTIVDGFPDEEFLPEADDRFHSAQRDVQITFLKDGDGQVGGFLWKEGGRERKVPRIGPLFHSLKPQTDPDPARTEKVVAALKALARGREGDRRFDLAHARSTRGFRQRPRAGTWQA